VEGEGRTDGVAAQALPALEVVGVDADAGVEREAVEADAVAGTLEGFGEALAPVHFSGLERGEGVGLRLDLVVEPDQQLGGAPDEAGQDPGQADPDHVPWAGTNAPTSPSLARFAWLSIAAAVTTITMKTVAWRLTGSVGLLSDAMESVVNLEAAIVTLLMVSLAARPPDEDHVFGHTKAEYFASGAEGMLILVAAAGIGWTAIERLLAPQPLEQVGWGVADSCGASLVSLVVSRVMLKAGNRYHSIAPEADGHHLMTDVWTGVSLLRRSVLGLLDTALRAEELAVLKGVLARHEGPETRFHALRTRQAASRRFVSMHALVSGAWTVARGHALLEGIEAKIREVVPGATGFTHLEAIEDPAAWGDEGLDGKPSGPGPDPAA
jgi:divalent metal cation (Fe/Co/Zn/Cd) transporter